MKKMREINYIFYMTLLYMLSSLYGVLFRMEVPRILKIENLNNLSILFLVLLITGYLITNFFKSLKEVFKSGVKKLSYIFVFILGVNTNNVALIYAISICLIGAYTVLFLENRQIKKKEKNDESENKTKLELYPSRRNLMEILSHALGEYSLIALDGTWGSGKTTFMNIFMRDKKKKYYYIPINVMLFENRNSLKSEFLNQLKGIFKEEGIFQGSLMDFDYYLDGISNDWMKMVKNIIFSKSKSFKEANEKLKSEIGKIEKKIVVGVDNLERIYGESEPEWKQILGFIHELQELGIKIVVMANLEEMLTTKKETGEKDLSNHEYFDKFYEFKLKLNDVTTEEIIEGVEYESLDKEWLKSQFEELKGDLDCKKSELEKKLLRQRDRYEYLKSNREAEMRKTINTLNSKDSERGIKEIEENNLKETAKLRGEINRLNEILLDLEIKIYENTKNPRKIKKVIEDIKSKKKIERIHNIDSKEYKKLIFKTSIFQLFYFDYFYKFKNEKEGIFSKVYEEKDLFLDYIEDEFKNNIQVVNRLLYSEPEDENVKKRIENLNEDSVINVNELERCLEDIKVYSERLDEPDMKVTKEKYKIIESKLIELEKYNMVKVHKIIKEREELICKINYLTYPSNLGIFKDIKYKFNNEIIYMMYRKLEDILKPRRVRSRNELRDMLETINIYYYFQKENFTNMQKKIINVNSEVINKLINKLKSKEEILKIRKEKNVSSIDKAESIIYDMVLNFLMIIKSNMEKQEIAIRKELKLENWEEYDLKQKEKLLNVIEDDFVNIKETSKENPNFTFFIVVKTESDLLKNIIEKEENQTIILKLDDLIRAIEYRLVEFEILKKANDINIELDNDKRKSLKEELLSFIKIKSKEERLQYMFDRQYWEGWMKEVEKIGIKEEEWTIKPQGEKEEETEEGSL